MEKSEIKNLPEKLHESLQELIGLHRQLFEVVKAENEAISQADIKATYEASSTKEALLHLIHQAEMSRQTIVYTLSEEQGLTNPSLKELVLFFQAAQPKTSEQLQSDLHVLILLVERIKKQNELNGSLISASLKHIGNMKKNIFGETTHQARTYNQQGHKNEASANEHGPRLISREV